LAVGAEEKNNAGSSNELTVKRFCSLYSPFGPERKQKALYPGETVFFHAELTGLALKDGEKGVAIEIEVLDTYGKVLASRTQSSTGKPRSEDNRPSRIMTGVAFPAQYKPGVYVLRFKFTDLLADASTTYVEDFELKPLEFAIVRPRFFQDSKGEVPTICGGFEGQHLYVNFSVIGENEAVDQHGFDLRVEIFDEQGRQQADIGNRVDATRRPTPGSDMFVHFNCKLPEPGKYMTLWKVTELSTGKTATYELPLVVYDPLAEEQSAGIKAAAR